MCHTIANGTSRKQNSSIPLQIPAFSIPLQAKPSIMAYLQLFYHIVFRTKESRPAITEEHERGLYAYLHGIIKNMDCHLYRINSMPDHMHLFVGINPTISLADFVQRIKLSGGNYMRAHKDQFPLFDGWGRSYCAITYSSEEKERVINYIKNQKAHHQKTSYADELKALLAEHGITYSETYFLKE